MKKILTTVVAVFALIGGMHLFLQQRANTVKTRSADSTEKLRVVTTNSILEDMVQNVGKDRIHLYSIVKRGTDPHEYEPQPSDVSEANEADVMFYNGLNLETGGNGWFTKLVETSHKKFNREVFAASKDVKAKQLTTNVKEDDPHAWLDLENGIKYVETITEVLKQKDPRNATFYQANADAYVAKLRKLHVEAQSKYLEIPQAQRVLITSEGAFKYFADAYHVTPAYIWEINTEAQGTPEQMKKVIAKINDSEVKHLFVESSVSAKSMDKVAKETGLDIYSKVFTDSLAKKGAKGDTYYSMMKWNIEQIYKGLK
ncbi:substrate binding protein [Companilactobacillus mindensis DSM 14500]|uniref:Substrate binding protein n=1 Tax=Companilactobacillus mindensis DSM 14500 TaxID=1423770 RepID=A0A0R1QSU1_9LACO|nr:zinc ABC transporter substrate-binding protein [Companilactobacillus mindensis]KRL44315.1 substrate binding protein [Companilactobacillus mindensis DSM 14500]GEO79159.1 manganese ABC transporter substrate-binding protein [Companilactobacillus mindensis]